MIRWSDLSIGERNLLVHTEVMVCISPLARTDLDESAKQAILTSLRTALPDYTSDLNWTQQIEDQVEQRGLFDVYVRAICRTLGYMCDDQGWLVDDPVEVAASVLRATPEQRCIAALRAVGVEVVL